MPADQPEPRPECAGGGVPQQLGGILDGRPLGGVHPVQVVQPVAELPDSASARRDGQQVGVGQPFDDVVGGARVGVQQGRHEPGREVRYAEGAQEPEGSAGPVVQGFVAESHAGADGDVSHGQFVEAPVLVREPLDHGAQGPVAAYGQVRSGRPQGERQTAAQPGDAPGRGGLGRDPFRSGHPGEQGEGLGGAEDIEFDAVRTRQCGEPAAGGDQAGAGCGAR